MACAAPGGQVVAGVGRGRQPAVPFHWPVPLRALQGLGAPVSHCCGPGRPSSVSLSGTASLRHVSQASSPARSEQQDGPGSVQTRPSMPSAPCFLACPLEASPSLPQHRQTGSHRPAPFLAVRFSEFHIFEVMWCVLFYVWLALFFFFLT